MSTLKKLVKFKLYNITCFKLNAKQLQEETELLVHMQSFK